MKKKRIRTYGSEARAKRYAKLYNRRSIGTWRADWTFYADSLIDSDGCVHYAICVIYKHDIKATPHYVVVGKLNWYQEEYCYLDE